VVGRDTIGDLLEDRGFASLGRRHNQPTLTTPDWGKEIDQPRAVDVRSRFELETLVGEDRSETLKNGPILGLLRIEAVDRLNTQQRIVLFGLFGLPHLANDHITGA